MFIFIIKFYQLLYSHSMRNSMTSSKFYQTFYNQSSQKSTPVRSKSRLKSSQFVARSREKLTDGIQSTMYQTKNSSTLLRQLRHKDFIVQKNDNKKIGKLASLVTYVIKSADKALTYLDFSCNFEAEFAVKLYLSDREALMTQFNNIANQGIGGAKGKGRFNDQYMSVQHLNMQNEMLRHKLGLFEDQFEKGQKSCMPQSKSSHNFYSRSHPSNFNAIKMVASDSEQEQRQEFDFVEKEQETISNLLKKVCRCQEMNEFLETTKRYGKWRIESLNQKNSSSQKNAFKSLAKTASKRIQQLQNIIVSQNQRIYRAYLSAQEVQSLIIPLQSFIRNIILSVNMQTTDLTPQNLKCLQTKFQDLMKNKQKDIQNLKNEVKQLKKQVERVRNQLIKSQINLQDKIQKKDGEYLKTHISKEQAATQKSQLLQQINLKSAQIVKLKEMLESTKNDWQGEKIRWTLSNSTLEQQISQNKQLLDIYKANNQILMKSLAQGQNKHKQQAQKSKQHQQKIGDLIQQLQSSTAKNQKQNQQIISLNKQLTNKCFRLAQENASLLKQRFHADTINVELSRCQDKIEELTVGLQASQQNISKHDIYLGQSNYKHQAQKLELQKELKQSNQAVRKCKQEVLDKIKQIQLLQKQKASAIQSKQQQQKSLRHIQSNLSNKVKYIEEQLSKSKQKVDQMQASLLRTLEEKDKLKQALQNLSSLQNKRISELQLNNKLLNSQFINIKSFLKDNRQKSKETIQTLQQLVSHLKASNTKLTIQNKRLVESADEKYKQISDKFNQAILEKEKIQNECDFITKENKLKLAQLENYSSKIEKMTKEINQKDQIIQSLQKQSQSNDSITQSQLKKALQRINQLQEISKSLLLKSQEYQSNIQAKRLAIFSLESQLKASYEQQKEKCLQFTHKQNNLLNKINNLEINSRQLSVQIQTYNEIIRDLKALNEGQAKEISELSSIPKQYYPSRQQLHLKKLREQVQRYKQQNENINRISDEINKCMNKQSQKSLIAAQEAKRLGQQLTKSMQTIEHLKTMEFQFNSLKVKQQDQQDQHKRKMIKYQSNERVLIDQIITLTQKMRQLQSQNEGLKLILTHLSQKKYKKNSLVNEGQRKKKSDFEDFMDNNMQQSFISVIKSQPKESQIEGMGDHMLQSSNNFEEKPMGEEFEDFSSSKESEIMYSISSYHQEMDQMSSSMSFSCPSQQNYVSNQQFMQNAQVLQIKQELLMNGRSYQKSSQFQSFQDNEEQYFRTTNSSVEVHPSNAVPNQKCDYKQFIIRNNPSIMYQ